ncbi:hypothetical protein OA328_02085 [Paracoccaceae bacterium]|nr:hypothetical protein [Paracoccaceae bacterium]
MKNDDNKKSSNANTLVSLDHNLREFELFKSRVANAVLDYMETQSDLDLLECIEKSSMFLANISVQMEKVFDNQKSAVIDENDMFEIADDLFLSSQQTSSSTIH